MEQRPKGNLGVLPGVHSPTILTIRGVIMYLRFGWVVDHLGLSKTIITAIIGGAITSITILSFSSMATNRRVGGRAAVFLWANCFRLKTSSRSKQQAQAWLAAGVTRSIFGGLRSVAAVKVLCLPCRT